MPEFVWALRKSAWDREPIVAVYSTYKDARNVMDELKAEAKYHRFDPDSQHDLEMNLYVEKFDVLPPGDRSVTFEQADRA